MEQKEQLVPTKSIHRLPVLVQKVSKCQQIILKGGKINGRTHKFDICCIVPEILVTILEALL